MSGIGVLIFGLLVLISRFMSLLEGIPEWEYMVLGVAMSLLGIYVIRNSIRRHKRIRRIMSGDTAAMQEEVAVGNKNTKWTWRINGIMVSMMIIIMICAFIGSGEFVWWQKVLILLPMCIILMLVLHTTVAAWRSKKQDAS